MAKKLIVEHNEAQGYEQDLINLGFKEIKGHFGSQWINTKYPLAHIKNLCLNLEVDIEISNAIYIKIV